MSMYICNVHLVWISRANFQNKFENCLQHKGLYRSSCEGEENVVTLLEFLRGWSTFQSCDWLQAFFPSALIDQCLSRQHVLTAEQGPLPGSFMCSHPLVLLILSQGSGPQDKPLLELAGQPSPCDSCGTLHHFLREKEEENCQAEKREGVWFSDRWRALPKLNRYLQQPMACFQLLNHSNKCTEHEFLGVRLLRASECLGFMMQETVTDFFKQHVLRLGTESLHSSVEVSTW